MLLGDKDPDAAPLLPDGYAIWLLLLLPVLYLFVVGIHELGHVVAGRWQNFDFYGLTIGPLAWKPNEQGKISFRWNKSLNLSGGVALMLPSGTDDLRHRFLWFAAGGPLTSLLLAVVAYAGGWLLGPPGFGYFLLLVIASFSFFIFVATILPFQAGGFASDGLRILTFARNGPTAGADIAGLWAAAHLRSGKPHADLPVEDFATVATDERVPAQQRTTMDFYRYLHALAVDQIDEAARLYASVMDRLDTYPEGIHGGFYLEQAFFEAHFRRDLAAAQAAMDKVVDSPFTEALSVHLAEAALAALRNDSAVLAKTLPAIEASLPSSMDQGRVPQIRAWLGEWRAVVEA